MGFYQHHPTGHSGRTCLRESIGGLSSFKATFGKRQVSSLVKAGLRILTSLPCTCKRGEVVGLNLPPSRSRREVSSKGEKRTHRILALCVLLRCAPGGRTGKLLCQTNTGCTQRPQLLCVEGALCTLHH